MVKSKRERINHLIEVLAIQTKSKNQEKMVEFISKEFDRLDDGTMHAYQEDGNVYITKGKAESYPCVVAHMDTVHLICDNFKIYEHGDALFSVDTSDYTRVGIGGDDKVGVFCCLEALAKLKTVKIAFFRDEEIGCLGSNAADMEFFKDVSFILQADRKGYTDFVRKIGGVELFDDVFSEAIAPILKQYNKSECLFGGSTDVATLFRKGVNVCVANSSCGYYNPHRDGEYVIISEVFYTSDLFIDVINKIHVNGKRWLMPKYTAPVYKYRNNYPSNQSVNSRVVPPTPHDSRKNFHFDGLFGRMEAVHKDVICPVCEESISDMYDVLEDGYYCIGCNQYSYLPDNKWGVNDDFVDDNIINKSLHERSSKRNRNRRRNRK